MKKIISHGIKFLKAGKCKRCGSCEKKSCPHFKMMDGLSTCLTYGKGDYLKRKCYEFPNSPLCRVIQEGICGFKFIPATKEDAKKYKILLDSVKRSKEEYGCRKFNC